jgi:lysophospholipid hydrolase
LYVDYSLHFSLVIFIFLGKSIGLVLSGGGARGLSHLGLLQNFSEQNIPIDFIGGSSQGSFMAALYSMQKQHHIEAMEEMKKKCHTLAELMGSIKGLLSDVRHIIYFSSLLQS